MALYVLEPEGAKILDGALQDADDERNAPGSRKAIAEEMVRNVRKRGSAGRDEEMARILKERREAGQSTAPPAGGESDDLIEDPDG